jgi:hypothetical protein
MWYCKQRGREVMQVEMLVSWLGKGVGAFIINYCMRMRVLLGFDFSVLRLSERERERWQLGICEEIGTRYLFFFLMLRNEISKYMTFHNC